jgi:glucose/arabinose dehydrogenase
MPVNASRRPLRRLWLGASSTLLTMFMVTVPVAGATPQVTNARQSLDRIDTPTAAPAAAIRLNLLKSGFSHPVFITNAKDSRLFVVEQTGYVRILRPPSGSLGWHVDPTPFLDVHTRVLCCGEQGLLGLAFHPGYKTNGRFFFYYTNTSGNNVIAEGHRSATSNNHGSYHHALLVIAHPGETNHNGGDIGFGPDHYLYIGTGDGGGGGDIHNNAQNLGKYLGKLLRIDVDHGTPFGIPSTNPFAGSSNPVTRAVWSYGLRNPWRWSHDRKTGELWVGDVGQEKWEEVDHSVTGRGVNYGWHVMEGKHCYSPPTGCDTSRKTLPIAEYGHSVSGADNCAIVGGYVYRGRLFPSLKGQYFFADDCSGRIWNIPATSGDIGTLPAAYSSGLTVSSFGQDQNGELYLTELSGKVWRVRST